VVAGAAALAGVWLLNILPLAGSQIWRITADAAWRAGNPSAALSRYRAAAAWYPTRVDTLLAAGQAAEAIGDDDQALGFYTAATAVVAHEPQARIGLARIWARRGNPKQAASEIKRTSLSPTLVEAIGFTAPLLPLRSRLDIGETPAAGYGYIVGLYPPEGLDSIRWTGSQVLIRFGTLPTPDTEISLRMSSGRPNGVPDPEVVVLANGNPIARVRVPQHWRTYRFVVPSSANGVRLTLRTDTFVPARVPGAVAAHGAAEGDFRPRGVFLDWAALAPLNDKGVT